MLRVLAIACDVLRKFAACERHPAGVAAREAYDCRFGMGTASGAMMACDGLRAAFLIDCFMRYRTFSRLAAMAALCLSPLAASLPLQAAEPKINNFAVADAVVSVSWPATATAAAANPPSPTVWCWASRTASRCCLCGG